MALASLGRKLASATTRARMRDAIASSSGGSGCSDLDTLREVRSTRTPHRLPLQARSTHACLT